MTPSGIDGGTAGDFEHEVHDGHGRTGAQRNAAELGDQGEALRAQIGAEDLPHAAMPQPCAGVDAEQSPTLHQRAIAGIGQLIERIDDGGERAVGRRDDGIGQCLRHLHDTRAGPQHDVARVAAIEAAAVARCGVAVLEEMLALLRQVPLRAGRAVTATVCQRPRHPLSAGDAIARALHHVPHGLVPQHAGRWRGASSIDGVQIGTADGGQRDFDQHLPGLQVIGKRRRAQ